MRWLEKAKRARELKEQLLKGQISYKQYLAEMMKLLTSWTMRE